MIKRFFLSFLFFLVSVASWAVFSARPVQAESTPAMDQSSYETLELFANAEEITNNQKLVLTARALQGKVFWIRIYDITDLFWEKKGQLDEGSLQDGLLKECKLKGYNLFTCEYTENNLFNYTGEERKYAAVANTGSKNPEMKTFILSNEKTIKILQPKAELFADAETATNDQTVNLTVRVTDGQATGIAVYDVTNASDEAKATLGKNNSTLKPLGVCSPPNKKKMISICSVADKNLSGFHDIGKKYAAVVWTDWLLGWSGSGGQGHYLLTNEKIITVLKPQLEFFTDASQITFEQNITLRARMKNGRANIIDIYDVTNASPEEKEEMSTQQYEGQWLVKECQGGYFEIDNCEFVDKKFGVLWSGKEKKYMAVAWIGGSGGQIDKSMAENVEKTIKVAPLIKIDINADKKEVKNDETIVYEAVILEGQAHGIQIYATDQSGSSLNYPQNKQLAQECVDWNAPVFNCKFIGGPYTKAKEVKYWASALSGSGLSETSKKSVKVLQPDNLSVGIMAKKQSVLPDETNDFTAKIKDYKKAAELKIYVENWDQIGSMALITANAAPLKVCKNASYCSVSSKSLLASLPADVDWKSKLNNEGKLEIHYFAAAYDKAGFLYVSESKSFFVSPFPKAEITSDKTAGSVNSEEKVNFSAKLIEGEASKLNIVVGFTYPVIVKTCWPEKTSGQIGECSYAGGPYASYIGQNLKYKAVAYDKNGKAYEMNFKTLSIVKKEIDQEPPQVDIEGVLTGQIAGRDNLFGYRLAAVASDNSGLIDKIIVYLEEPDIYTKVEDVKKKICSNQNNCLTEGSDLVAGKNYAYWAEAWDKAGNKGVSLVKYLQVPVVRSTDNSTGVSNSVPSSPGNDSGGSRGDNTGGDTSGGGLRSGDAGGIRTGR